MIPFVFPVALPLKPLERISPSRFSALKKCRLKEVWAAGGAPQLLAVSPAARVGTIIHAVLEGAGKGKIREPHELEETWNASVERIQARMSESDLERHLVPLSSSALYFEVKKRQCLNMANEIVQSAVPHKADRPARQEPETEKWLQTSDGLIGGNVDRILHSDTGTIILDYKSGAIFEESRSPEDKSVKAEYQVQLKLYAGLYHSVYNEFPAALRVVALDGSSFDIGFTHEDCLALLDEARHQLADTNQIVASNESVERKQASLASPEPGVCRYCSFRPACLPYLQLRLSQLNSEADWPADFSGRIVEKRLLGNGYLLVKIVTERNEQINLRGLTPQRHRALNGDTKEIMVFSARRETGEGNYAQGSLTSVYASAH